jgi:hypothetical protein
MGRLLIGTLVLSTLLSAAVAGAGRLSATRYPSSIVVLGHSGATGRGSIPGHGLRDAPENSWATGTNPAVKSVYSRILAVNPAIRGHAVNLAQDGATVTEFAAQARRAVALTPKPELVLVFIGNDDVKCDGTDQSSYPGFRAAFSAALDVLSKGLPNARIFVLSMTAPNASYVKYLEGLDKNARLKHAGKALCQLVDSPSGRVVPAHVAYLNKIVTGYDAQLAAACAHVPLCRYDGGVVQRLDVTAADLTPDQRHLTVEGNAKLAAAEWAAMAGFVNGI